ncbi:MAG: hypothetical protein IJI25_01510 [Eubacterium sp.]|nr:hypothetical protein [Eubacterium sp.]
MKYLNNHQGYINRLIAVLLVLVAIMLVIVSVPLRKAFQYRSECIACEQAMKSAGDGLIIEYLHRQKEDNVEEARNTILEVMPAREKICPSGGNVYLIKNDHGVYEPICGLHNSDKVLRTRLNASCALDLLKETRRNYFKKNENEPEALTITLNSKPLKCLHVTKEEMIHRGTDTTNGYKGTVAYYGVAGDFTFSAKYSKKGNGDAAEGDICYFVYADKDHCAIWRSNDGWSGDAYEE